MRNFDRFLRIAAVLALLTALAAVGDAKTRKGDKFMAEGRKAELRKDWDKALEFYEKALAEDPADVGYDLATKRVRFQAGQAHVDLGRKLRDKGELEKALAEFQKAYAVDPSSSIAEQELKRTLEMIQRDKKAAQSGAALTAEERALTPAEFAKKQETEKLGRLESPPELKPLSRQVINLRMSNQPPKVLFETVGKLAGINVVFDPDYGVPGAGGQGAVTKASVELNNATLEDALDYVATMTRSFWKPLSPNAIFVTQENQQKRREYEDNVVRVFYLSNLTTPQELQEISTVIRTVADIKKVFTYTSMSALIARGTPDQIMLAEKLVNDLDKPRAEVVVDVLVMTASRNKTRDLAAAIASNGTAGLSTGIQFTPRNPVLLGGSTSTGTTGTTSTTTDATQTQILSLLQQLTSNSTGLNTGLTSGLTNSSTTGTSTNTQQLMSLARIAKISTNDFSITMPGALLQAMMSDSTTRVLQSPQVRASNGQKASLKIGQKVPIASGGVQPFGGQVGGFSSLYNQFQFQDVGVNVDITPTVHGNHEVTLKILLDISSVVDHVDIAGISQPIIGQNKIEHEIRIREGEVSVLGGLMQDQDTKGTSGVPGLSSVPALKWLFSSQSVQKSTQELLIALIPHIVRTPGIDDLNLRSIAAGTDTVTSVRLSARPETPPAGAAPAVKQVMGIPSVSPPQAAGQPAAGTPPAPGTEGAPATPATPPTPPAPTETHLLFRPATVQIQSGATFTLQLDADNARDLFSAPFHLKFDPQVLKLQEIKAGTLLSSDGQKVIFTRNILNDSGDATVNLNRLPGTSGVSGSGTLAVFTFQAVKAGNAMVTFSELGARNSQMQPVSQDVPHAAVAIK
jgi:general secretion pathway protein D